MAFLRFKLLARMGAAAFFVPIGKDAKVSHDTRVHVVQSLVPLETPAILRHCSNCGKKQRFRSSDRFRVNSNHHRTDVWLIYWCETCSATWNYAILERVGPNEVDKTLYRQLIENDRDAAWRFAFDTDHLKRSRLECDCCVRSNWMGLQST